MAATAVIVHRIAGRVRLRIDEKRGDAAYFSHLAERMARFDDVYRAKANALTGSIALEFSGSLSDLLRRAKVEGLLEVAAPTGGDDHADGNGRAAAAAAGSRALAGSPINLVSGRDINRDFMTGTMLLLIGMTQMFRGKWFPPAFSVLWYAREAFNLAGRRR
ncbi:MAG TPA: hypothetical protein VJ652_00620 [Noviherbaspirillum sp.]|nr:hypothetical protein [Noviherbaspirillum sp.]